MIAHAVITTPRLGVNYLSQTQRSLWGAGFCNPLVVTDRVRQGPNRTFKHALRRLLERDPSAELLCCFQDDCLVSRGTRAWLESEWMRTLAHFRFVGVISLYCSTLHHQQMERAGWHNLGLEPTPENRQPWAKSYGAVAVAMPRARAEEFLRDDPAPESRTKYDQVLARWCHDRGYGFLLHRPSLVQHCGAESAVGNPFGLVPARVAADWCESIEGWPEDTSDGLQGNRDGGTEPIRDSGGDQKP